MKDEKNVRLLSLSAEDKLYYLKTYAPRVWLAKDEEYMPSSVDWAFRYLERFKNNEYHGRYWLRTKKQLESPSDVLPFFKGNLDEAPVYAFWLDYPMETWSDLVYFFYYPYNHGKKVFKIKFGNHVSDWEHMTLRLTLWFDDVLGKTILIPKKIFLSQHGKVGHATWDDLEKTADGHPIIFSAMGSHGCYPDPGSHLYANYFILKLTDETSEGTPWDTWKRIKAFDYTSRKGLSGNIWPTWMSDDFTNPGLGDPSKPSSGAIYRWGNPADGCGLKFISGECKLNDGPTGPISKSGVWDRKTFA